MSKSKKLAAAVILTALVMVGCHHKRRQTAEGVAPKQVTSVATLYEKGQRALKKKKPATARRYFDQIVLREDAGEYKDKATLAIADAFMSEHTVEAYAEAISRYQSFLAFHPTHPQAPYCQYQIGQAYFEEIDTPDRDITAAIQAREAFRALTENYPDSRYAAEGKQRMAAVDDILAAHEIRIGDWYLKQGHPKGAIGRYRYVLDKYPTYWNLPLVYYRLGEALARDGQTKEAGLYFTRIVQEVPQTVLARDAQKRLDRLARQEAKGGKVRDAKVLKEPLVKPKESKKHWWKFWK